MCIFYLLSINLMGIQKNFELKPFHRGGAFLFESYNQVNNKKTSATEKSRPNRLWNR